MLKYVDYQTEAICLTAVKKSGLALVYVQKQTPEIIYEAVKQDDQAIQFIDRTVLTSKTYKP